MTFDDLLPETRLAGWQLTSHGRWGFSFVSERNDPKVVVVVSEHRNSNPEKWAVTARAEHEVMLSSVYAYVSKSAEVIEVLEERYDFVLNRLYSPMGLLRKQLEEDAISCGGLSPGYR